MEQACKAVNWGEGRQQCSGYSFVLCFCWRFLSVRKILYILKDSKLPWTTLPPPYSDPPGKLSIPLAWPYPRCSPGRLPWAYNFCLTFERKTQPFSECGQSTISISFMRVTWGALVGLFPGEVRISRIGPRDFNKLSNWFDGIQSSSYPIECSQWMNQVILQFSLGY